MRIVPLIGFAVAIFLAERACAEHVLLQNVPVACVNPTDSVRSYNIALKMPAELSFLVGAKWILGQPMSARIGQIQFAATSNEVLNVTTPQLKLTLGTVGGQPQLRVVASDRVICDASGAVELSVKIADRSARQIRIRLVTGENTSATLDPDRISEVLADIRTTYLENFNYVLGDDQRWLTDFLRLRENERERRSFAQIFCNECSWVMQQRLAFGLAKFLDRYPVFIGTSLGSPNGPSYAVLAPEEVKLLFDQEKRCEEYPQLNGLSEFYQKEGFKISVPNSSPDDYLRSRYFAARSNDDQILRLFPPGSTSSFIEFHARRSMPANVLGLERVFLDGKEIGGRCE